MMIWKYSLSATVIDTIMLGYDKGTATSSATLPINVSHQLSITSISRMDEKKMSFEPVIIEKTVWTASELAFENNNAIDLSYKTSFVVMNPVIDQIWIPKTQISNIAKNEYRDQSLILYPNGTLVYTAYRHTIILVDMPIDLKPFASYDDSSIAITVYIGNENSNTVQLNFNNNNYLPPSRTGGLVIDRYRLDYSIFDVTMEEIERNNVFFDYSGETHSGLKYKLKITSRYEFFFIAYFIPSLLIVFLSWAGFWLDKAAVPARVSIGVTPILMTANLMIRAGVVSVSWQTSFFMAILVFTAIPVIEYATVNF
jgi:gamma-aminobutyric acid receptor subunit delta